MSVYASGGNYQIELVKGIARCRVWKRPDISREEGAKFAEEKIEILGRLAAGPRVMAKALLFDLRAAPERWGPVTQGALEKIFLAWEIAGRRLAVLCTGDPIQGMLIKEALGKVAPTVGQTFLVESEAEAHCLARTPVGLR